MKNIIIGALSFTTLASLFLAFYYRASLDEKMEFARKIGVTKGYSELSSKIQNSLGYTVTPENEDKAKHFINIKETSYYILEVNGVKTIAIWEGKIKETR